MTTYYVASATDLDSWTEVDAHTPGKATEAFVRIYYSQTQRFPTTCICSMVPQDRRKCRSFMMVPRVPNCTFGQWMAIGDIIPNLVLASKLPSAARYHEGPTPTGWTYSSHGGEIVRGPDQTL